MNVPIKCPVCNDPMLTEFSENGKYFTKSCRLKLDHRLEFFVHENEIIRFSMNITSTLHANWLFNIHGGQMVEIWENGTKGYNPEARLPFFEPDLSNYKKLVSKIKAYLVLS